MFATHWTSPGQRTVIHQGPKMCLFEELLTVDFVGTEELLSLLLFGSYREDRAGRFPQDLLGHAPDDDVL
jgi:hypothetical protein